MSRSIKIFYLLVGLAMVACDSTSIDATRAENTTIAADVSPVVANAALAEQFSRPLGMPVQCELSLSANVANFGDLLTLTGLPDGFGQPAIRVLAEQADDQPPLVTPLFVQAGSPPGTARFTAPLHPSLNPEGGEVAIEIGDGVRSCESIPLTLLPLPEAPTDYAETVASKTEQLTDALLTTYGFDPDELLALSEDQVPVTLYPMWIAKQIASAPHTGYLPAEALAASSDPNMFIERFLMATNIEGFLDTSLAALSTFPSTRVLPEDSQVLSAQRRVVAEGRSKASSCNDFQFLEVDGPSLDISTAAELSERVQAAKEDGVTISDVTSVSQAGLNALGVVANLGGTSDFGGALGKGSGAFSLATTGVSTLSQFVSNLEPQVITDFSVMAETNWVEDRPQTDPLRWFAAKVSAQGRETNLARPTLDAALSAIGLVAGPVSGTALAVGTTLGSDTVNASFDRAAQDSCFRIKAPEYGPLLVNDPAFTASRIDGAAFGKISHQEYIAIDRGAATLEVQLNGAAFGLEGDAPVEQFMLTVEPLFVTVSRDSINVAEPGEQVEISASVANAYTEMDDFSAMLNPGSKASIVSETRDGAFYTLVIATAPDREDYPDAVTLTVNNHTLPDGANPVTRKIEIDVGGKVTIEPRELCLTPGQSTVLTGTIEGFRAGNDTVTWISSGGSFDDDKSLTPVFTAPQQTGSVEITLFADDDLEVDDTVTLTVDAVCLRKQLLPAAAFTLDGSGVYSPIDNGICPPDTSDDGQLADYITDEDIIERSEPEPPASDLWADRVESVDAAFGHTSTRHKSMGDQCPSISLSGSNSGQTVFTGEADGTMRFESTADLAGECADHGDGDVECVGATASMSALGKYYLDIDSEQTYRVFGAIDCFDMDGDITIFPVQIGATRYAGGSEPASSRLRNTDSSPINEPFFVQAACTMTDESVLFDKTFVIDAPADGQTDVLVLQIGGGVISSPGYQGKEGFEPWFTIPDPMNPPAGPEPGQYTGGHDVTIEVDLQRVE